MVSLSKNTTPSFAQHGTLRLSSSHNLCTSGNEPHGIQSHDPDFLQRPLWPEGTVLVDPAAPKETMMHHALGEQKKGDGQPN
jgi:hypothetical protein